MTSVTEARIHSLTIACSPTRPHPTRARTHPQAVIGWAAEFFARSPGLLFLTYEQIHPHDQFGQTMMHNLRLRGCPLLVGAESLKVLWDGI